MDSTAGSPAFERHANRKNSLWYRGDLITFHVEGSDTGGQLAMIEYAPKRGLEPPVHIHSREDEIYYVIDGEMVFSIGGKEFPAKRGSTVFLPRNVEHGWTIQTPAVHLLITFAPAGLEGFFKALADPIVGASLYDAPHTGPDTAKMLALASQYGLTFLPAE